MANDTYSGKSAAQLFTELIPLAKAAYDSQLHLSYHNWSHISSTIMAHQNLCVNLQGGIKIEEQIAILFHDIVYVPQSPHGLNELLSVVAMKNLLDRVYGYHEYESSDFPIDIHKVSEYIMHTVLDKHLGREGYPVNEAPARVMDSDLAGLGAPWPVFLSSQDLILLETIGPVTMGNEELVTLARKKQAQLLKEFLNKKPNIYWTKTAQDLWEDKAVENIEQFVMTYS